MSDRFDFEKEYKRFGEKIVPSEEFRSRLTIVLEKETEADLSEKSGSAAFIKMFSVSAAACLILIAGGAAVIMNSLNSPVEADSHSGSLTQVYDDSSVSGQTSEDPDAAGVQAQFADLSSYNTSIIDKGDEWYEDGMTDEECAKLLAERLTDGEDLEYLSVSDTPVFTDADEADGEEIYRLAESVENSVCADDSVISEDCGEDARYYMAVFANGDIVKITVYEDNYIIISDIDAVFEIK